MPNAIEISSLSRSYGERAALSEVSFSVAGGEIFGLLGPNGGGKTTLFRVLSTLLPPSSGTATIFGYDVVANALAVRQLIGVVFQANNLDRKLTAYENLRHQGNFYGLSGGRLDRRIDELLEKVGLTDRRNDLAETLSGGQRRRIEIAKGLVHSPSLLLLDEPSTGLDPGARRAVWDYLLGLQKSDGVTILLTTHILEEADQCERLAILDSGKLVATGTPDELKREIGTDIIYIDTHSPDRLTGMIRDRFSIAAELINSRLRIEQARGHEFIPRLVEAFPGEIKAVAMSRPTLEDVFLRRTGHMLWDDQAAQLEAPRRRSR
jgi:ABC-2 type transport system ATP-binding protein